MKLCIKFYNRLIKFCIKFCIPFSIKFCNISTSLVKAVFSQTALTNEAEVLQSFIID